MGETRTKWTFNWLRNGFQAFFVFDSILEQLFSRISPKSNNYCWIIIDHSSLNALRTKFRWHQVITQNCDYAKQYNTWKSLDTFRNENVSRTITLWPSNETLSHQMCTGIHCFLPHKFDRHTGFRHWSLTIYILNASISYTSLVYIVIDFIVLLVIDSLQIAPKEFERFFKH